MDRTDQVLAYVKREEGKSNLMAYRNTEYYGRSIKYKSEAAAYRKVRYFIEQVKGGE